MTLLVLRIIGIAAATYIALVALLADLPSSVYRTLVHRWQDRRLRAAH